MDARRQSVNSVAAMAFAAHMHGSGLSAAARGNRLASRDYARDYPVLHATHVNALRSEGPFHDLTIAGLDQVLYRTLNHLFSEELAAQSPGNDLRPLLVPAPMLGQAAWYDSTGPVPENRSSAFCQNTTSSISSRMMGCSAGVRAGHPAVSESKLYRFGKPVNQ